MSIPHDYYDDGRPELHSKGNSHMFVEPDWLSCGHDASLPLLSTLGCGPKGSGVIPEITADGDGEFSFKLTSDVTGEVLLQSPNLSAGIMSVVQNNQDTVTIAVSSGGSARSYQVKLPQGRQGSLIFTLDPSIKPVPRNATDVYQFPGVNLFFDGRKAYASKPDPKPDDIVVFRATKGSEVWICFGYVESWDGDVATVTCRCYIDLGIPYIGPDGNWWINGESLGAPSRGDPGIQGPQGKDGKPGESLNIQEGQYREPGSTKDLPDLPEFTDTQVNWAYIVDDDALPGQMDLYYHAPGAIGWQIIQDWGGIPGPAGKDGQGIDLTVYETTSGDDPVDEYSCVKYLADIPGFDGSDDYVGRRFLILPHMTNLIGTGGTMLSVSGTGPIPICMFGTSVEVPMNVPYQIPESLWLPPNESSSIPIAMRYTKLVTPLIVYDYDFDTGETVVKSFYYIWVIEDSAYVRPQQQITWSSIQNKPYLNNQNWPNSTSIWVSTAPGLKGQVLRSDGSGKMPVWTTPGAFASTATSATISAKTAVISATTAAMYEFSLEYGKIIAVQFPNGSTTTTMSLNVNNSGEYPVVLVDHEQLTTAIPANLITKNSVHLFVFQGVTGGSKWVMLTETWDDPVSLEASAVCASPAADAAKTLTSLFVVNTNYSHDYQTSLLSTSSTQQLTFSQLMALTASKKSSTSSYGSLFLNVKFVLGNEYKYNGMTFSFPETMALNDVFSGYTAGNSRTRTTLGWASAVMDIGNNGDNARLVSANGVARYFYDGTNWRRIA